MWSMYFNGEMCRRFVSTSSVTRSSHWASAAIRKALQNTGPADFRQYPFVDTPYTHGYCLGFLAARFGAPLMGGVAQLGERLNGIQEVRGSIPLASIAGELVAPR